MTIMQNVFRVWFKTERCPDWQYFGSEFGACTALDMRDRVARLFPGCTVKIVAERIPV